MQKLKRYLFTTSVFFLFWLAYTSSLKQSEILTGLVISLILSYFTYQSFSREKGNHNILSRFLAFLKYLPVFLWEMIKANLDVAKRVVDPSPNTSLSNRELFINSVSSPEIPTPPAGVRSVPDEAGSYSTHVMRLWLKWEIKAM